MSEFISVGKILETHWVKYMIDAHNLEKLRQKDFTRFIKTPVRLVGGKRFTPCPFHKEKSPSFCIYPDNSYYCFGCGAFGNAIDFLMKILGYDFKDACKTLEAL